MMFHAKSLADRGEQDETGFAIWRLRKTVMASIQPSQVEAVLTIAA
jgi:hypothetical protein